MKHNNSNIIAFGSRVSSIEEMKIMLNIWIEAQFEGDRHAYRVEMIEKI